MKKFFCFLFLIILAILSAAFNEKSIKKYFGGCKIIASVDGNIEGGIYNGSTSIIEVKMGELKNLNYNSIIFKTNNFNLNNFINYFGIIKLKEYYVEDTMLFEGYSNSFKHFHNSGMVQIVKIGEEYFIGFPTIYSF